MCVHKFRKAKTTSPPPAAIKGKRGNYPRYVRAYIYSTKDGKKSEIKHSINTCTTTNKYNKKTTTIIAYESK